ncbi:hypothetical protein BGX24_008057 [Mortierella sp. AD032]|nr:hypothetical protein BGX24_008057 [Mortierella sp. AD032]
MRRKKHNPYLSPQHILSTLSSPLDASPSRQLPRPHLHPLSSAQTSQPYSTSTASPQTLSIFDIPLIFDQICNTLSYEDVWACMRVNKLWNVLARPHHWRSFRSTSLSCNTTLLSRIASVNVPLVRSLDLNVFHTDMLDIPFANLIRLQLHFGSTYRAATSSQGPNKALALICRNTRLQELNVHCTRQLLQDLDSSVLQFLYSSHLRSLNLEDIGYFYLDKVQSILAHCPDTLQELRLVFRNSSNQGYDGDGNPIRLYSRATAIPRGLPNLRALTLDIPEMEKPLEVVVCDLIQSCPRLQEINLLNLSSLSNILTSLTKNTPSVDTVSFNRTQHTSEADTLHFLARCSQLRSFAMDHNFELLKSVVPILVDRFGSTLQELIIYESNVHQDNHDFIATVLAHCSCLKKLSIGRSYQSTQKGIALQDLLEVEWASTSLESLSIPIKEPFDQIEHDRLLQEWRQHRYIYLDPEEYDPDGVIARSKVLVDMLSRLYRRFQAQSRLPYLQFAWHRMWHAIPLEFVEVFSNGQLTERRLGWMSLFPNTLCKANKNAQSAEKRKKEAEEDRALMDKLYDCNISVVRVLAVDPWMDYGDNKDNEVDYYDPSCFPEDQEYSAYKSRKERCVSCSLPSSSHAPTMQSRRQKQVARAEDDLQA